MSFLLNRSLQLKTFLSVGIFLILCQCGPKNQKAQTASSLTEASVPAFLGNGYNHMKLETKLKKCINGEIISTPDVEVLTEFSKVENWSRLQSQMGFTIPGSIHLGGGESDVAKFALRARDSHLSATYVLKHSVAIKKEVLSNPKLLVDLEDKEEDFLDNCGTRYISTLQLGGRLYVGIKFSFSSEEYKESFEGSGGISTITGLGARVKSLNTEVKGNSSVELFVHQIGGNLPDLATMFNSEDIIKCSLAKFEICEEVLKDVYDYSVNKFSKAVFEGKFQVIDFSTVPYPRGKVFYEDHEILEARNVLLDKLEAYLYDRDIISSFKLRPQTVKATARELSTLSTQVSFNIRSLKESISLSFTDPERFKIYHVLDKLTLHDYKLPEELVDRTHAGYAKYLTTSTMFVTLGVIGAAAGVPFIYKFFHH